MTRREHWDRIYGKASPEGVSWYRPHLERSIEFIEGARLAKDAAILDVGAGPSTLVDDLLERGYENVTVLDISRAALVTARERLGARAARVTWIEGDITELELPPSAYDFWHDRAVFHFLNQPDARRRYISAVRRALKPAGHIVVATFGHAGPETCSGLDVMRYDAEELHGAFGGEFTKISGATEIHTTPWGSQQEFVYCYCRMSAIT